MTDSDEFDVLFAELKAAYAAKLPGKFNTLAEAIDLARANPDRKLIKNAANEAHKIKGTAGSHGFTDISKHAEILEDILESMFTELSSKKTIEQTDSRWQEIDTNLAKGKMLAEHVAAQAK